MESDLVCFLGEPIPGTSVKAFVAPVDAIAYGFPVLDGNRSLVFDCQIRDASARIEPIRFNDCVRRTSDNAPRTASTSIASRFIRLQIKGREDNPEKEPG